MFGLHTKDARAKIIRADAASYSTLSKFDRTPAHARYAMQHPSAPTAAMERGTALHMAVLEPDRFDAEVATTPRIDRRTKEGKAAWAKFQAENIGKVLLDEDDHAACLAMRDMLRGPGYCEVGAIWEDPTTGQACKALIDRMGQHDGWTYLVDLKKTRDASSRGFARTVASYGYHAQAAMIVDGCDVLSPRDRRFAWIAVEEEPPHCVAVYDAPLMLLSLGREKWRRWLDAYIESQRTQTWGGYPAEIRPLELPKWAYYDEEKA
jgi:exodeoxyribonuclease VIII